MSQNTTGGKLQHQPTLEKKKSLIVMTLSNQKKESKLNPKLAEENNKNYRGKQWNIKQKATEIINGTNFTEKINKINL